MKRNLSCSARLPAASWQIKYGSCSTVLGILGAVFLCKKEIREGFLPDFSAFHLPAQKTGGGFGQTLIRFL